ncbi:MAG TPA: translation initiation factor IF-2 N-terminal domain-containing protein, partial [Acidimicrobiales bacterium]
MHELAKELGLTSKELLGLAAALGIGASSPSASIEDAQADRIRRRADAEGLRREAAPEAKPVKPARTSKAPAAPAAPAPAVPAAPAPTP